MSLNQYPALPLPDAAPDPESEDYHIEFKRREFGAYSAIVRNEYGDKVDEVREPSFDEAYHTVARNYPQASWEPDTPTYTQLLDDDEIEHRTSKAKASVDETRARQRQNARSESAAFRKKRKELKERRKSA